LVLEKNRIKFLDKHSSNAICTRNEECGLRVHIYEFEALEARHLSVFVRGNDTGLMWIGEGVGIFDLTGGTKHHQNNSSFWAK
jgi:hypothetical protein